MLEKMNSHALYKLIRPVAIAAIFVLSVMPMQIAHGQGYNSISLMVAKTCDVMSGKRELDGQTLQYLIMLDSFDLNNPIGTMFRQQVIQTCPKDYLAYQQRKRVHNPFPPGSLIKKEPTPLINGSN